MKILSYIFISMLLTSCFTINKPLTQHKSINSQPRIVVPFDTVDVNNDGNISKTEYIADASTLDTSTPGVTMLSILVGVGVLVGVLIFLTTCYKGPTGLGNKRD